MKQILLFDFDGTIADSFESFLKIANKLATKHNFPQIPLDDLEGLQAQESLFKTFKVPFYKIPFIARDFKKMQMEQISEIKPIAGLPEALHKLKDKGYEMGIITSNSKENVKFFLENNDIDIFTHLYSNSSIFGKDILIRRFLKKNNIKKEDAVYIGDTILDVKAAQKVGIKVVAVTWGFNSRPGLMRYSPDFLINTSGELLELLDKGKA